MKSITLKLCSIGFLLIQSCSGLLHRKRPKFVLCFVRLGRGAADQATSSSAAFARRSAAMRAGVSAAA
jgi:hypothetical protein